MHYQFYRSLLIFSTASKFYQSHPPVFLRIILMFLNLIFQLLSYRYFFFKIRQFLYHVVPFSSKISASLSSTVINFQQLYSVTLYLERLLALLLCEKIEKDLIPFFFRSLLFFFFIFIQKNIKPSISFWLTIKSIFMPTGYWNIL